MSIIKNYLYNVSYQVFILIVPMVTTPYITRVLGSDGVGINAYTNSIILYFVLFGSIGVTLYGNRTIAFQRDDPMKISQSFWEITFLRFTTIFISFVAFFFFLISTRLYTRFYLLQSIQLLAAALDISWLFMGMEDFKRTVIRNFLVKSLSVASIFLFVKTSNDTGVYITILGLSTLIGNISLWGYLGHYVKKPILSTLRPFRHLRPSIALFIPEITMQVYLILNKTMLGNISGVQSAGFYDSSDKIIKMALAVVTSISTVMLPRMANVFAKKDIKKLHSFLYASFDFVSFISVPLGFGLAAISKKFATLFMGPEFAITGDLIFVMSLIILPVAWTNVLGNQYLLPTNQTKKYTFAISMGALVNIVLNVLLIESFGVMGAVVATVFSEVTVTVCQILMVRKQVSVSKLFWGLPKYLIPGTIMFAIVYSINKVQSGSILHIIFQVFVGIVVYIVGTVLIKAPFISRARFFLISRSK